MTKITAKWGVVATVKADPEIVQKFVVYYLETGADWVSIYFDDPRDPAASAIRGLPKVTTTLCDRDYWAQNHGFRFVKIEARQGGNAQHAYKDAPVDWLAHIDVDEFIHSDRPIADLLNEQADENICVRMEPVEYLENPDKSDPIDYFRHSVPEGPDQARIVQEIYPKYAKYLSRGMLSHTNGKSFARTKVAGLKQRIHLVELDEVKQTDIPFHPAFKLCHYHANGFDNWMAQLGFRMTHGAYTPQRVKKHTKIYTLLSDLLEDGESDEPLRVFYREFQVATPEMRKQLAKFNLLFETTMVNKKSKITNSKV